MASFDFYLYLYNYYDLILLSPLSLPTPSTFSCIVFIFNVYVLFFCPHPYLYFSLRSRIKSMKYSPQFFQWSFPSHLLVGWSSSTIDSLGSNHAHSIFWVCATLCRPDTWRTILLNIKHLSHTSFLLLFCLDFFIVLEKYDASLLLLSLKVTWSFCLESLRIFFSIFNVK